MRYGGRSMTFSFSNCHLTFFIWSFSWTCELDLRSASWLGPMANEKWKMTNGK
jgi:hypothetical protein